MDHADIVDRIYAAAMHNESWSQALCSVVDHVGAVAGNIVFQSPSGQGDFLIPGRMRDDLNTLYLQNYTKNPYARAFADVKPGMIALGNSLIDTEAVRRSAFYADICEPQNIYNQIFMPHRSLHHRGGIGGIALFLAPWQDENALEAVERLTQLAPHLTRAIDLSTQLSGIRRNGDLLHRLLDTMPDAAILLDARGAIVLLNAAAENLLLKADGIYASSFEAPALRAHLPETSSRLTSSIRQALLVAQGEEASFQSALCIDRPSNLPPYIVAVTPLSPATFSALSPSDSGARVLVHIVDMEAKTKRQAQELQAMFGLTQAETQVAALIGKGMSLPEIARNLGISLNTVKTHASRCFGKTGARSQSALASLMASIPVSDTKARTATSREIPPKR